MMTAVVVVLVAVVVVLLVLVVVVALTANTACTLATSLAMTTQTNSLRYVINQFTFVRSLIILRNTGNRSSQSAACSTMENAG